MHHTMLAMSIVSDRPRFVYLVRDLWSGFLNRDLETETSRHESVLVPYVYRSLISLFHRASRARPNQKPKRECKGVSLAILDLEPCADSAGSCLQPIPAVPQPQNVTRGFLLCIREQATTVVLRPICPGFGHAGTPQLDIISYYICFCEPSQENVKAVLKM